MMTALAVAVAFLAGFAFASSRAESFFTAPVPLPSVPTCCECGAQLEAFAHGAACPDEDCDLGGISVS